MVGLKTVWISLCALFLVAACVPQTKQTDCRTNEAFNAQLRTCVPVVQDVDTFISFTSFVPNSSISRYKNDTAPMTFKVYVANPYQEAYTLRWKVSFNGVDTTLSNGFDATQQDILPITYNGEIGLHLLTVEAVNASNVVVADHHFEFVISNLPKPYIDTASVLPSTYTPVFTPNSITQTFQFSIKNNNSDIPFPDTYQTQWKLYKNGVDTTLQVPNIANQDFSNITPAGVHTSSVTFNPNILTGLGVGSYILRARIISTALTEVVDERQWSITVQHAPLSPILARDLIKGSTLPYATTVVAYHAVDYLSSTAYNFRPAGQPQANFCVKLNDGDGAYNGDMQFVKVSYFLDGAGSPVYEGYSTDIMNSEICLTDPANTNLSAVVFNNSSANSEQDHTIVARVYDVATGMEYTSANLSTGTGTYPLVWNVRVKPQNRAPSIAFGSISTGLTGCSATATTPRVGCTTKSDNNFTVSVNLTGDDFYFAPFDETKFQYSIKLIQDGTIIQECTKAQAPVGPIDADGTNGYQCRFNIPSYTALGPFNVTVPAFRIQASISDTGSPVAPTAIAQSEILTWNLVVTEENTAPVISAITAAPVAEGSVMTFNVGVSDPERDSFGYVIQYCKDDAVADPTCANNAPLTSGNFTKLDNTLLSSFTANAAINEDFLLNLPLIPCNLIARGATCAVRFRAVITDKPNVATAITFTGTPFVVNITNTNPAPVFDPTLASPNVATFTGSVFVGFPLTLSASSAGVITDASSPLTVEGKPSHRFQWYARNNTSVSTWQPIDSATSSNLIWSPSLIKAANLAADNPIRLMLCVEDQPANIVPTPIEVLSVCNDGTGGRNPWIVTVRNNMVTVHDLNVAPTSTQLAMDANDFGREMAVWYSTPSTFNGVTASAVYTVMIDNNQSIQVKKALVQNNGLIVPDSQTIITTFPALKAPAVVDKVEGLSVTGTANSLYISYMASSTVNALSLFPQVRRIDITPGKAAPAVHSGKVGFDYAGVQITNGCNTAGECAITNTGLGNPPTVQFNPTADITGSLTFNVGGYSQVIAFAAPPITVGQICSTCSAATMAQNLANAINANITQLQGLSAVAIGDTVTINGSLANDFIDLSAGAFSRNAGQMGSIYTVGGNFYVPFIIKTGSGSIDKMAVLTGAADVNIGNAGAIDVIEPSEDADLLALPTMTKLSTHFDGTELNVGMVTASGSTGRVYKLDPVNFNSITPFRTIMTGRVLYDINVFSSQGSNLYVGATIEDSGNNYMLGIYTSTLGSPIEFKMNETANVDATTQDYFNVSDIASYKIIPYGNEARVVASSRGTSPTDYHLYLARLYNNGTAWTLSCRECDTVSDQSQFVSPYVNVATADVRMKVAGDALYRLSSDGSVTNQGIKNVLFLGFAHMDAATAPTSSNPVVGVLNMEPEQVSATNLFLGPAGAEDAGLYRPPFLKN